MNATILFGHGARDPEWAKPFQRIRAAMLTIAPEHPVELGFLELMQPSLDMAIDSLVQLGANNIRIVPIFMAAGSHIKKDLPAITLAAMTRHSGLNIDIAAPVGEVTAVINVMADYALGREST